MLQRSALFGSLLILLLASCTKKELDEVTPPMEEPEPDWITHTIAKGGHYSDLSGYHPFLSDSLIFRVYFDSSAIYSTVDKENQMDWNKVIGFADCGDFHQVNSLRLGWRYHPEKGLELGAYLYSNQQRIMESLGVLPIGDTLEVSLKANGGHYEIEAFGKTYTHERGCSGPVQGYSLYPYFGGDETAPHEVRIHLQILSPEWEP